MRVIEPGRPTLASTARRTQIVGATIEVIAEQGLAQASFARIAEHAGISSTRLISYHFANKDELIGAVAGHVVGAIGEYVGSRIDEAEQQAGRGNATAILTAYIEGNIAFIDSHRSLMQALLQIVLSGPGLPQDPQDPHEPQTQQASQGPLEGLLRHGQSTGEFRAFDVPSVASAVQRAIEGLPFMLAAQPDLDCATFAAELVELYLRGVRQDAP